MLSLKGRDTSCSIVLVSHRRCSGLVWVKICCHTTSRPRKSENFSEMPWFPQNLNLLLTSSVTFANENTWIISVSAQTVRVFSSGRSVASGGHNFVSVVSTTMRRM